MFSSMYFITLYIINGVILLPDATSYDTRIKLNAAGNVLVRNIKKNHHECEGGI